MSRKRAYGKHVEWTEQEVVDLHALYPLAPWSELETAFPGRTRSSVKGKAASIGIDRLTRSRIPDGLPDDQVAEIKREKACLASKLWRERNPKKYLESLRRQDAKPERKAKQAARARDVRKTEQHKTKAASYRRRPEVKERNNAFQKTDRRRAYVREWQKSPEQKEKSRLRAAKRLETPSGVLNNRMRSGIRRGLTTGKGGKSWLSLVDYTLDQLIAHIEKQFLKGMSWENMDTWHIDHIIPLSDFLFSAPSDIEFKRAWSLGNLRPLWGKDNLEKYAKVLHLI